MIAFQSLAPRASIAVAIGDRKKLRNGCTYRQIFLKRPEAKAV
jgi:hypothetical protein